LSAGGARDHRVPRGTRSKGFHPDRVFSVAFPRRFHATGSSSHEPASSSEHCVPLPAPDRLKPSCDNPRRRKRLPWGSDGPSSRHQPAGATVAESTPLPATVRPRRSSRPRRFAPRPVLRVCFTPQPRSGFPPLRGLRLSAEPCRVIPDRCPRAVAACISAVARAKTPAADFRALLPAQSPVTSDDG
jgi:hypothetical protein